MPAKLYAINYKLGLVLSMRPTQSKQTMKGVTRRD